MSSRPTSQEPSEFGFQLFPPPHSHGECLTPLNSDVTKREELCEITERASAHARHTLAAATRSNCVKMTEGQQCEATIHQIKSLFTGVLAEQAE